MATEPDVLLKNRILQLLRQKPLTRPQISLETGFGETDVANALFHMRTREGHIWQDEVTSTFHLTKSGAAAAPPAHVLDLAKFVPSKGARHVVGVAGHFDFSKPLRGAKAVLYDALTKPLLPRQWYEAANMQANHAAVYVKDLLRLGVVRKSETVVGAYERAIQMRTDYKAEEPPKPKLTPAEPNDPLVKKICDANPPALVVSNFSKVDLSLEDAITEMKERFSPMEIMLATLAQLDEEYRSLKSLAETLSHIMPTHAKTRSG